jgi:hypothetical protein
VFSERSATDEPDALREAFAARRARGEIVHDLSVIDLHDLDPRNLDPRDAEREPPPKHAVSTSGGALASLLLLCDPGDEVLLPEPSHPRLARAAQLAGLSVATYPVRFDDGRWSIDATALWDAIGERTRAIFASSPNDVTGALLSDDELELLDSLGVPLILDQRLAELPLEARAVTPIAPARSLRLTLDGVAGTEWIAVSGPDAGVHEALARLAPIARALGGDRALPCATVATTARARASLFALREELAGSALEGPAIDAGWHAPVRLPPGEPDDRWALRLLERGFLTSPGSDLGFPDEEPWLVLSLLADPARLRLAARALRELVER